MLHYFFKKSHEDPPPSPFHRESTFVQLNVERSQFSFHSHIVSSNAAEASSSQTVSFFQVVHAIQVNITMHYVQVFVQDRSKPDLFKTALIIHVHLSH